MSHKNAAKVRRRSGDWSENRVENAFISRESRPLASGSFIAAETQPSKCRQKGLILDNSKISISDQNIRNKAWNWLKIYQWYDDPIWTCLNSEFDACVETVGCHSRIDLRWCPTVMNGPVQKLEVQISAIFSIQYHLSVSCNLWLVSITEIEISPHLSPAGILLKTRSPVTVSSQKVIHGLVLPASSPLTFGWLISITNRF